MCKTATLFLDQEFLKTILNVIIQVNRLRDQIRRSVYRKLTQYFGGSQSNTVYTYINHINIRFIQKLKVQKNILMFTHFKFKFRFYH